MVAGGKKRKRKEGRESSAASPSLQFPPVFFLIRAFSIPRARLSRSLEQATSQYETGGKNNAHLLSHYLPAREKIHAFEQAAFWEEEKVVCCLPTPFLHTGSCQVVTGTAVIFHLGHLAGRQDRQYVFPYNALS